MLVKFLKFILILLIYQSPLYSKNNTLNDFNSRFLSNYFSGIVAYENSDNSQALKFFNSSKFLIKQHEIYLEKYTFALVLNGKVKKAINQIKQNSTKDNSNFFQANLLLAIDSLKKGDYKSSEQYINRSYELINNDRFSLIIAEIFKEYLYVFNEKKIPKSKKKFGNFSYINEVFQRCYLGDQSTKTYFKRLINSQNDADYSRYAFFFVNYLIESEKYDEAKQITDDFDYLNSSLLISQGKKWIEDTKFKNFLDIFSCTNSSDIMGEFFFLVANLYSSQGDYEKSNFYLNISNYLNPKFTLNLSLLAENYYTNEDYENTKKTLEVFDKTNEFYYWFKIKKEAQIISNNLDKDVSLKFINSKFKGIKNPNKKMIFDIANFNKNAKKYAKAINYYDQILLNIDSNSDLYAEILYRRGGSYERSGDYKNADNDLLKSLEINPDDAYVLNYLAYSWVEQGRNYKEAKIMLLRAVELRPNDGYIADSLGWALFKMGDGEEAVSILERAVQLQTKDWAINDHLGDAYWVVGRQNEARFQWRHALSLKQADIKGDQIEYKIINGYN